MSDQLVIHTMKDDIAEMNSLPPVPSAPATKPKHEKPSAPVFSLPSKSTPLHTSKEVDLTKKHKNIIIGVGYIVLFFLLVAGAIYAYTQWGGVQVPVVVSEQEIPFSQIIPKETFAIIDYNFETQDNRSAVGQMWAQRSDGIVTDITSGNPTGLLSVPDVTEAHYVIIPDTQTPFLVVKKTEGIKEYVSQQREVQLFEKGGWYVLAGSSLEKYTSALTNGSIAEENPLLASSDNPNYLIRYAMSAAFVSQQFNMIAAPTIGLSRLEGLVFHVLAPSNDGTITASAHVPGNPPGEGVLAQTNELISLIPGDLTFGHVGLSFAEELNAIQSESPRVDSNILAQPAIRQFASLFTTPYAIFERRGSDGIRDIGLVLALPSSLQQKIKTGEPIVEQALPALIPLIVGKALGIQVAFNDGLYNGVPVRYVNINGQSQALDYSIGDNFLLVSSSREGISSLLDTAIVPKQGLSLEDPWKTLGEKAGITTNSRQFIAGTLKDPALISVLPISIDLKEVPIIVSSGKTSTGTDIQAVLLSR